MLIWYFSNNLDTYDYVGKLPEQCFSVWLFFHPGDKILVLLKLNEARISEWNLTKSDLLWKSLGQPDSKSRRASKWHYWFKSYNNFDEWVDYAYWPSFSRRGSANNGATLSSLFPNRIWKNGKSVPGKLDLSLHLILFTMSCY